MAHPWDVWQHAQNVEDDAGLCDCDGAPDGHGKCDFHKGVDAGIEYMLDLRIRRKETTDA